MTTAIYDNRYTCWNRCTANPCDKCGSLRSLFTDANCVGLARNPQVVNIDVVVAPGEIYAGFVANCNVIVARRIIQKRGQSYGGVVLADAIGEERINPNSRIGVTLSVVPERRSTNSRVIVAADV